MHSSETTDEALSESLLSTLQTKLEVNCNEANNYHCRIVTELAEDSHSPYLRIWPKTDDRGEYVKRSGWDSVLRATFTFEETHDDVYVTSVNPDDSSVLVRERPLGDA